MNHSETINVNQLVEGILYILAKPVTLKKLSFIIQIEIERIEEVLECLKNKYDNLNTPFRIDFTRNNGPENCMVELKLSKAVLESLSSFDFFSTQELPAKFYRFMSTIMLLEYVKKKQIDKKLLEKELKMDTRSLENNIRTLIQYGFLKKTKNYYTTSKRFLKRMGLPTNEESVIKVLKEKTIEYALDQFGFKNE